MELFAHTPSSPTCTPSPLGITSALKQFPHKPEPTAHPQLGMENITFTQKIPGDRDSCWHLPCSEEP